MKLALMLRWTTPAGALLLLSAAGCLGKVKLVERTEVADASPPCGARGEACCSAAPACGAELVCDGATQRCAPEERRLCNSGEQCPSDQRCCPTGLLGSCMTLAPEAACPLPDLTLVTSQQAFLASLQREDRVFLPESSARDACALEQRCIEPGAARSDGSLGRRLLRFSFELQNIGDADLILGAPALTDAFQSCAGAAFIPNFLSYELRDNLGMPQRRGSLHARCQPAPAAFRSRFDCDFWGLWSGFSQLYEGAASDPGSDCQWLDISSLAAGRYDLVLRVNPDGLITEKSQSNNEQTLQVVLPALDALAACPAEPTQSYGALDSLLGIGLSRECGWRAGGSLGSCRPGEVVELGCPDCSGDPLLRVCDGAASCSNADAWASANDTFTLFSESRIPLGAFGEGCEQSNPDSRCQRQSGCPWARFSCPPSGSYGWMLSGLSSAFSCNVRVQAAGGADAGSP